MPRGAVFAVCLLAAAGIAPAAGAEAASDRLIRPGRGIGPVSLGMPLHRVTGAIGRPTGIVKRRRLGFGSEYVEYVWADRWGAMRWSAGVLGRRSNRVVVMVATGLRRERTGTNVGVGSSERTVQRRLGARCSRRSTPLVATFDALCHTGGPAGPNTVFRLGGSCDLPPRTYVVCPMSRRVFRVYEVIVATATGLRLTGVYVAS